MNSQAERELTTDLFREERAQMMNREYPLCMMSERMDWTKADEIVFGWFEGTGDTPFKSSRCVQVCFF